MTLPAGLAVVRAPNPGLMTGPGTNQYLLGEGQPLLLDVAPLCAGNRAQLERAAPRLGGVLLTHVHPDHVGGVPAVRVAWGVSVAVHRSHAAFRVGDVPIAPERLLDDGDEIAFPGGRLQALHTPGHESGHCCFFEPERRWLFTGDTILSTGTTVIAPPDGDMGAYLDSLRRLQALGAAVIFPAHGPPIERPDVVIAEYLSHRLMRERQVLAALADGIEEPAAMVPRIYPELHPGLAWAAAATARAHCLKLVRDGVATVADGDRFRLS